MNTLATTLHEVVKVSCPYSDMIADVCRASISAMKLRIAGRLDYCASEDYDGCPIFLAKVLRKR